ncbi:MAG: type I restriction endonuclease subunit S [Desulfotalea sp.]|nr:MAG: type I restriction endonuclease subunit S [Desulfotalea sp.]
MNKHEIQSFGEAFNGKTPSKVEQRSAGKPILKIRDIDENGQFRGRFESFVEEAFYKKHSKKKLRTNDTIILNAAHNSDYVGSKNAFVPPELNGVIATGEWLIVRVKDASPSYVNHFLKSPLGKKSLKNCVKGIHLYPKDVERIKIPFPPLEDQKRIAHLLGKVEKLIAQRKQHLQQLDDLLKGVFLEMFGDPISNPLGYPIRPLSEFYVNPKEGTKCGPFGSALKKAELVEAGIPVWNMDNIDLSGRMILPFRMWITEKKHQELLSYSVVDGDIVISRAGTVGKMCVAKMDSQTAIISTNLIRLRLGAELLPSYFVALMTYCKGRIGRLKTGPDGAFTHMNTGILNKLEFPYPPIELQSQFAVIVEKIEGIKSYYQQSLFELENLYGALSQKAFKGELDLSRVPLPIVTGDMSVTLAKLEGEAHGTVHKVPNPLPDPGDLKTLDSAEGCSALIEQWLNVYLEQFESTQFSTQNFMETAQQKLWELLEDEAPEWGATEYDQLKTWVFQALESGRLTQSYDEDGNRVQITSANG